MVEVGDVACWRNVGRQEGFDEALQLGPERKTSHPRYLFSSAIGWQTGIHGEREGSQNHGPDSG